MMMMMMMKGEKGGGVVKKQKLQDAYNDAVTESRDKREVLTHARKGAEAHTRRHQREMDHVQSQIAELDRARKNSMGSRDRGGNGSGSLGPIDATQHRRAMKEADEQIAALGHEVAMAEAEKRMKMLRRV